MIDLNKSMEDMNSHFEKVSEHLKSGTVIGCVTIMHSVDGSWKRIVDCPNTPIANVVLALETSKLQLIADSLTPSSPQSPVVKG